MQNTQQIINAIGNHTGTMGVALTALCWLTDDVRKSYYSDLQTEDVPHNMETLFSELSNIYSLLSEELNELKDYKRELEKGSNHVQ